MIAIDAPNYKLTGHIEEPLDVDYNLYGLHKKRTILKGELLSTEYYKEFDGITYSDLVLSEARVYTRNIWGLVMYRVQTVEWYLQDNTVGCSKVTTKYYSPQQSMEEFSTRMGNIMSEAQLYVADEIGLPNALDFMTSLNNEITLYIRGEHSALLSAISTSTKPYLTPTIINNVISILTF